jgi:sulfoxide reductase heme-binding subunit YedZ
MSSGSPSRIEPLGADGDQRRRFLFHHLPLGVISGLFVGLFTMAPAFDATLYGHADIFTGPFPRLGSEHVSADAVSARSGHHGGGGQAAWTGHGAAHILAIGHHGQPRPAVAATTQNGSTISREPAAGTREPAAQHMAADGPMDAALSRRLQQLTVATGYACVGLLVFTLLLGPANLLLRRRNPVSTYLRRDVGIWTAGFSIVHVVFATLIHTSHGSGLATAVLHFFVGEDRRLLTNSFGLGNWTGLAALVIVLGLLATSNDAALRRLKAKPWKWIQRLTYILFALIVLHAFFYGALLRMNSPFTWLLVLSAIAVCLGQAVGVRLWRRKYAANPG